MHRERGALRSALAASWLAVATLVAGPERAAAQSPRAPERAWRAPDVALAGAFTAALWIDAAQTREAIRRGYSELNPILGRHPSVGQVNTYTALAGLTTLGVAAVAPARKRLWLLAAVLAVETVAITANAQAGIAVKF
ncbi:MAG TPA: hypothetical protein VEU55_03585 [Gemmatimonadales bacterium]|nr:hypothetical protein [Gemmatimonadales bacterium]